MSQKAEAHIESVREEIEAAIVKARVGLNAPKAKPKSALTQAEKELQEAVDRLTRGS